MEEFPVAYPNPYVFVEDSQGQLSKIKTDKALQFSFFRNALAVEAENKPAVTLFEQIIDQTKEGCLRAPSQLQNFFYVIPHISFQDQQHPYIHKEMLELLGSNTVDDFDNFSQKDRCQATEIAQFLDAPKNIQRKLAYVLHVHSTPQDLECLDVHYGISQELLELIYLHKYTSLMQQCFSQHTIASRSRTEILHALQAARFIQAPQHILTNLARTLAEYDDPKDKKYITQYCGGSIASLLDHVSIQQLYSQKPPFYLYRNVDLDLSKKKLRSLYGISQLKKQYQLHEKVTGLCLDNNNFYVLNIQYLLSLFPNLRYISAINSNINLVIFPFLLPNGFTLKLDDNDITSISPFNTGTEVSISLSNNPLSPESIKNLKQALRYTLQQKYKYYIFLAKKILRPAITAGIILSLIAFSTVYLIISIPDNNFSWPLAVPWLTLIKTDTPTRIIIPLPFFAGVLLSFLDFDLPCLERPDARPPSNYFSKHSYEDAHLNIFTFRVK